MKKKFLALISILTLGALTACSLPDIVSKANDSESGNSEDTSQINLPNTLEEAVNKLYQLGKNQGFVVTFTATDDETGAETTDVATIGFKNDVLWVDGDSAYKKAGNELEFYTYNEDTRVYDFDNSIVEDEQISFDYLAKNITASLYAGYQIAGDSSYGVITSEKNIKFLGRDAKEYNFVYNGLDAQASIILVFDNETGITLKIAASAIASDGSSKAEFEVTSFKVGNDVILPTLNKNTNPDNPPSPGPIEEEDDPFTNKKLDYLSNVNANVYEDSTLCLFSDGKFELSFDDNGGLVVMFGTYAVNNNALATLTVTKVYKERTKGYTDMSASWPLSYSEQNYSLVVSESGVVNYVSSNEDPTHLDVPVEGGGGQTNPDSDAQYKISEQVWTSLIADGGLCNRNSNFTANVSTSDNEKGFAKYEFDSAKVHYTYKDESSTNEQYYVYNEDGMTRTYYYQDNYGAWNMGSGYASIEGMNNSLGLLPIPFNAVMFSVTAKAYTTAKWKDNFGSEYTNIMFKFENGDLKQIHYTDPLQIYHETNFSKHGTTSVTLPELGGGNHPTPEQLNDLVRNKVYVYDSALDNTHEYPYANKFNDFFNGNKISFFSDDTFEIVYARVANYETGEIIALSGAYIGTYQVQEDSALQGYNKIALTVNKVVVDGVLVQDDLDETTSIRITPNENKVTIWEYDQDIVTYYHKSESLTPTHITYSTEQPEPDPKWPATGIANYLAELNLDVTLPAPKTADDNIVGVNYLKKQGALNVIITFTDPSYAINELANYFGNNNPNFFMDYNKSDFDNYEFVYISSSKLVFVTLTLDQTNGILTIVVSKNTATVYPREAIAQYFIDNEVGASLPYLAMDNVFYDFSADMGYLSFAPVGENTVPNIKESIVSVLFNNGFKVIYMVDHDDVLQPVYVAPEFKYAVMVIDSPYNDGAVWAYITTDASIMEAYSLTYPTEAINESIPAGLRDNLPSFAYNESIYAYIDNGDSYSLYVNVQPNDDASKLLMAYTERLTNAGYIANDNVYTSADGEVTITIESEADKLISINLVFNVVDENVTYTFVKDNEWNIMSDDAKIYAYVWNNKGEYEWIELYPEEDGTFILETSSNWIGCKIVRFSPDSEIDWKYGSDGSFNPDVTIWNQTDDIVLNGQTGTIHFNLHG